MLVGYCGYLKVVDTFSCVMRSRGNGVEVGSVVVGRAGERTRKRKKYIYISVFEIINSE